MQVDAKIHIHQMNQHGDVDVNRAACVVGPKYVLELGSERKLDGPCRADTWGCGRS